MGFVGYSESAAKEGTEDWTIGTMTLKVGRSGSRELLDDDVDKLSDPLRLEQMTKLLMRLHDS